MYPGRDLCFEVIALARDYGLNAALKTLYVDGSTRAIHVSVWEGPRPLVAQSFDVYVDVRGQWMNVNMPMSYAYDKHIAHGNNPTAESVVMPIVEWLTMPKTQE